MSKQRKTAGGAGSRPYRSGRGFHSDNATRRDLVNGTLFGTLSNMRSTMSGSMDARWSGASTNFDWRSTAGMHVMPYAMKPQRAKAKGRPDAPAEEAPLVGPAQAGPVSNQSFAESSILPSDQSKSGMASDAGPAAHSGALPMNPMGSALPWTPGRGVGPRESSVYPAAGSFGGMSADRIPESAAYPAVGAYGGMTTDSPIWSAGSGFSLGSDSPIYSAGSKEGIGGKDRRRAGINPTALSNIGQVRRNGGWPGA